MPKDFLTPAVRAAIRGAPCTVRALAREAGLAHSTLVRVQSGDMAVTPAIASAVARALRSWGATCGQLAEAIEEASP